jgi:hypothetical protein
MYVYLEIAGSRQAGARGDAAALGFWRYCMEQRGCKKKKKKKKVSSSSCELL